MTFFFCPPMIIDIHDLMDILWICIDNSRAGDCVVYSYAASVE